MRLHPAERRKRQEPCATEQPQITGKVLDEGNSVLAQSIKLVPEAGIEPARALWTRGILSPLRLPIPPLRQIDVAGASSVNRQTNKNLTLNAGVLASRLTADE